MRLRSSGGRRRKGAGHLQLRCTPYGDPMARTQTLVHLNDRLLEQLDAESAPRGISRSALVREAVERHLAEVSSAAVGRQIVAGYQRVPQNQPDEWGDLNLLADASTRETLQRLDAEEAAAGLPPW